MSNNNFFILVFGMSIFLFIDAGKLRTKRMLDGHPDDNHQIKYTVAIFMDDSFTCSGGIIDDQYILTAAYCVVDKDNTFKKGLFHVVAGTNELNSTHSVNRTVENIFVNAAYNGSRDDWVIAGNTLADIAVLKLSNGLGVQYNKNLSKLNLPRLIKIFPNGEKLYDTYEDTLPTVSGYGIYNDFEYLINENGYEHISGIFAHKLQFAFTKVWNNTSCQKIWQSFGKQIYSSQMCAPMNITEHIYNTTIINYYGGICKGDYGAPLVINNNVIIGVVSSEIGYCMENYVPALYTRVSSYIDFIEDAKNNNLSRGNIRIV